MLYWLTMKCRSGCPHCMQDCKETDTDHATIENTKAFVSFFRKMETKKLLVSGGEPTEHPDFDKHLAYILENTKRKNPVSLATNGMLLLDKEKRKALFKLGFKHKNLFVQITNLRGLYPYYEQVADALHQHSFSHINKLIVPSIVGMQRIGRGEKNWDTVKMLSQGYERLAPACFNLYSIGTQSATFKDVLKLMSMKLTNSWCTPSVMGATGDIYAGETRFCTKIGNIADMGESALKYLKEHLPCGKCGE